MPKKPKTPKPLPSVLTVAGPSLSTSRSSRPKPRAASSPAGTIHAVPPTAKPKTFSRRNVPSTSPASRPATRQTGSEAAQPRVESPSQAVEVTFALHQPHAQRVLLGGSFNQWEARLALPPGRHEYKFLVDGQWVADPNATAQASNEYGTVNSIVEV